MSLSLIKRVFIAIFIVCCQTEILCIFSRDVMEELLLYISEAVLVKYDVLDNFTGKQFSESRISLCNTGSHVVLNTNWSIYFNHLTVINVPFDQDLDVAVVNGQLYRLFLVKTKIEWYPSETISITFTSNVSSVSRTDFMPNWYVAAPGFEPKVLRSTIGESLSFVEKFYNTHKWKRNSNDVYDPPTPSERYDSNSLTKSYSLNSIKWQIIPTPIYFNILSYRVIDLKKSRWKIIKPEHVDFQSAAILLREKSGKDFVKIGHSPSNYIFEFIHGIHIAPSKYQYVKEEAYAIIANASSMKVSIMTNTSRGAFNAVQTLLSLFDMSYTLPECKIFDAPRFEYRGFHLDVARNFRTAKEVTDVIDAIATYKLNKLHLHLTDDEGWRIDIPDIPELTRVGGKRCHDLTETKCILPFLGATPVATLPGSGFYMEEDYKSILNFAVSRGVEVIPEIDVPGHAHAAIRAIRSGGKNIQSAHYSLWDDDDQSEYLTNQHFKDNAINPCIESTYLFIEKIMDTLINYHKYIQPLKAFHFGGDEVGIGAWSKSPLCSKLMKDNPSLLSTRHLKLYFAKRLDKLAKKKGIDLSTWEDGLYVETLMNRSQFTVSNATAYSWNNVWETGGGGRSYEMANSGYKVVIGAATHLYFDHPHSPDPEERGLYWATRYISTFKTFSFMPFNIYHFISVSVSGNPINATDVCGEYYNKCPPLRSKSNIIGLEGHLWSELIRTKSQMYEQMFPRLLALAERSWHEAPWEFSGLMNISTALKEDWDLFASIVGQKELKRLDRRGIPYHIEPPGVKLEGNKVLVKTEFPGTPVEFSPDRGLTWLPLLAIFDGTEINNVMFRSKSMDNKRSSLYITPNCRISVSYLQNFYCDSLFMKSQLIFICLIILILVLLRRRIYSVVKKIIRKLHMKKML